MAVNRGEGFVLNGRYARRFNQQSSGEDFSSWWQLRGRDPDSLREYLTYTLKAIAYTDSNSDAEAPKLERLNDDGEWAELAVGGTFTQEDANAGLVRLVAHDDGSFMVSLSDEKNTDAVTEELAFTVREITEAEGTELGGGDLDLNKGTDEQKSTPKTIKTGLGDTTITPSTGDDVVDPGLGDDDVDLGAGEGTDAVI